MDGLICDEHEKNYLKESLSPYAQNILKFSVAKNRGSPFWGEFHKKFETIFCFSAWKASHFPIDRERKLKRLPVCIDFTAILIIKISVADPDPSGAVLF